MSGKLKKKKKKKIAEIKRKQKENDYFSSKQEPKL